MEGAAEAVETMLEYLRTGPSAAKVEGIDVRREDPRGAEGFRVTG